MIAKYHKDRIPALTLAAFASGHTTLEGALKFVRVRVRSTTLLDVQRAARELRKHGHAVYEARRWYARA